MANLNYHCRSEDVGKYGLYQANLLKNIEFTITKGLENDRYFHRGRGWMYGTAKEFSKRHIYLSEQQVKYHLKKLVDAEILIVDSFNKRKNDRTNWYSFSDKEYENRVGALNKGIVEKPTMAGSIINHEGVKNLPTLHIEDNIKEDIKENKQFLEKTEKLEENFSEIGIPFPEKKENYEALEIMNKKLSVEETMGVHDAKLEEAFEKAEYLFELSPDQLMYPKKQMGVMHEEKYLNRIRPDIHVLYQYWLRKYHPDMGTIPASSWKYINLSSSIVKGFNGVLGHLESVIKNWEIFKEVVGIHYETKIKGVYPNPITILKYVDIASDSLYLAKTVGDTPEDVGLTGDDVLKKLKDGYFDDK